MRGAEKIRAGYRELRWDHPRVIDSPIDHEQLRERPYSWIGEHRVVMSYELERPLTSDEHVHHVDGNKLNNTPRNLLVVDRAYHRKLHEDVIRELVVSKVLIAALAQHWSGNN